MVDDFSMLHDLFRAIEMTIDAEWSVVMMESVIDEMRFILEQLLSSLLGVAHILK